MKYSANYDKYPFVQVSYNSDDCISGWFAITDSISERLKVLEKPLKVVVIECYQGVFENDIRNAFAGRFNNALFVHTDSAMLPEEKINDFFYPDITDDELFGYLTRYTMECFFDFDKVTGIRQQIEDLQSGIVIVYGVGAAYLCEHPDLLIYADMARWEIQSRFRKNEISNIGVNNKEERTSLQYKRAFFVDWRICDRHKKMLMAKVDYVLDTNRRNHPKMITGKAMFEGLEKAVNGPFRVVPFFDPGPWGGQWMKDVCDLERTMPNYAWCFDCVPEENSLLLAFGDEKVEIPSIDLIFAYPRQLLGDAVYGRFGDEFPIRFDFLDTIEGGNLSLQVHPLTEYIQQKFGMHYTQDESYYLLDADEDEETYVYLGLKEGVDKKEMERELRAAEKGEERFPVEKYVNKIPVKKHDHVLIPAGTVHCSGKNTMVLEISATPYIFTFKLWDWGRLGMDGLPRPIHLDHGMKNIQWNRDTKWVYDNIVGQTRTMEKTENCEVERTGLHSREFIDTIRYTLSGPHTVSMDDTVHVMNLVEGRSARIESMDGSFAPFTVHYAETAIVPAAVGTYRIVPEEGEMIKMLVASVG